MVLYHHKSTEARETTSAQSEERVPSLNSNNISTTDHAQHQNSTQSTKNHAQQQNSSQSFNSREFIELNRQIQQVLNKRTNGPKIYDLNKDTSSSDPNTFKPLILSKTSYRT